MSGRHPGWQWMVEQGAEEPIGHGHEEENRQDKEKTAAAILSRSSLTAVVNSRDMLSIRASRTSTISHSSSKTYRILHRLVTKKKNSPSQRPTRARRACLD